MLLYIGRCFVWIFCNLTISGDLFSKFTHEMAFAVFLV